MSALAAADLARAADDRTAQEWQNALDYYWRQLLAHFGPERDVATLRVEEVRAYVAARRAAGIKGQTIRREIQCLKRGVGIALERRDASGRPWLDRAPCPWPKVKGDAPDAAQRGKWHDPEVLSRWLAELEPAARDAVTFAVLTGVRATELTRVSVDWIEPAPPGADCAAFLRMPAASTKTRTERLVPLSAEAENILRRRGSFGVACHRRSMVAAARRIGYGRTITLRDLRHVFGTIAERSDRKAAQDALGHTTERMTARYLHSDEQRLAAVGAAVAAAIGGGHRGGAPHDDENAKSAGGRRGFRTHGIQLVRPIGSCNHAESQAPESQAAHAIAGTCTGGGAPQGAPPIDVPATAEALLSACGGDLEAAVRALRDAAARSPG
jgi:integrase